MNTQLPVGRYVQYKLTASIEISVISLHFLFRVFKKTFS